MSTSLRVGLCQLLVGRNKAHNVEKAAAMVREAAQKGAQLVVLPECFNCPYGTKYFKDYAEVAAPGNPTFDAMAAAARDNKVWLVAGSFPEIDSQARLFNSSVTFSPAGTAVNVHRKVHLFKINTETVKVDESEVLTAGRTANAVTMPELGGLKMGVGICFDIRFPQMAMQYSLQGTSLLVYPGAFNMVTGPVHWQLTAQGRAIDSQQFVLLCSPARDESAEYVAWGHSLVVDPWGTVVASLTEAEGVLCADLDLSLVEKTRARLPIISGTRWGEVYSQSWSSAE
jgi:predicted amidohydrolase